jgi:hypothetical protein
MKARLLLFKADDLVIAGSRMLGLAESAVGSREGVLRSGNSAFGP